MSFHSQIISGLSPSNLSHIDPSHFFPDLFLPLCSYKPCWPHFFSLIVWICFCFCHLFSCWMRKCNTWCLSQPPLSDPSASWSGCCSEATRAQGILNCFQLPPEQLQKGEPRGSSSMHPCWDTSLSQPWFSLLSVIGPIHFWEFLKTNLKDLFTLVRSWYIKGNRMNHGLFGNGSVTCEGDYWPLFSLLPICRDSD